MRNAVGKLRLQGVIGRMAVALLAAICFAPFVRAQGTSVITTVAGTGKRGDDGDHELATKVQLDAPWGLAVDKAGNLYIADQGSERIRKVDTQGVITTVAGGGTMFPGDNQPATNAILRFITGISLDAAGNLYIADSRAGRIRKVNTSGIISTVVGNGGVEVETGNNGKTQWSNCFYGDNGPAIDAGLCGPTSTAVDGAGNLYIACEDSRIRKVDTHGVITTIAGTGETGYSGDNVPAAGSQLNYPTSVLIGDDSDLYIADTNNFRVRKIDSKGMMTTVAGAGIHGSSGDHGPATSAPLKGPLFMAFDAAGDLYFSDNGEWLNGNNSNCVVRKVDTKGIITTVAGTGKCGYAGDGGPASSAKLKDPTGIAVDSMGNLYIADGDVRVRKVTLAP
jgi:hypothetical protein